MGNRKGGIMKTLTLTNRKGRIIAKLYFKKNGNLHPDSWLCPKGWGNK